MMVNYWKPDSKKKFSVIKDIDKKEILQKEEIKE